MTTPRSHTRPPNGFRRSSLVITAIVTTLLVAIGVGSASAATRHHGRGGFGNAQHHRGGGQGNTGQGQNGKGQGKGQSADPSASASTTDTASADPSATDSTGNAGATDSASPTQTGPVADDFVSINQVQPKQQAGNGQNASTGSFTEQCGNKDHQNTDNFIAAPGVTNGAHHKHDYVGNQSTSGQSTDQSLAAAGTTCKDGNKSTFFWTVVRDLTKNTDALVPGEDAADLNTGKALTAKANIQFVGNPNSKVTAMPEFLRILAGDAKAPVNGGANQHAQFTCQGFTNRISTDKYTLCPGGRGFTRIHEFPSCWDGQNLDSANHRTHVVYPDAQSQTCPASNPVVIPKLLITLVYNVPAGRNFDIDSFPESLHNPISDHDDFENVSTPQQMTQIVDCINSGKKCA